MPQWNEMFIVHRLVQIPDEWAQKRLLYHSSVGARYAGTKA